jgi:hypothetical protein
LNLSLQDDVKLNQSSNAWKPSHLQKKDDMTEEEKVTFEVLSKFRSMLNKLTAENFDVLVELVKTFKIDTTERLDGVSWNDRTVNMHYADDCMCDLGDTTSVREGNFGAQVCADLCKLVQRDCEHTDSADGTGAGTGQAAAAAGQEEYAQGPTDHSLSE